MGGSSWAGLLVRVRGCGYFFDFFVVYFLKFGFYYWDLSFSLKSDIDVTVQPHLKMFRLCATTRVMRVRHLPHDWDTTAFALYPVGRSFCFRRVALLPARLPLSTCAFHPPFLGWCCFHLPPFCGSGSTSSFLWWCRLPPSLLRHVWEDGSLVPLPRL